MRTEVTSRVWAVKLKPTHKLVLLALAQWADKGDGSLHPSVKAIAERACISRSQAQRILHGLIEAGLVSVVGNFNGGAPGSTRKYELHLRRLSELTKTGSVEARKLARAREESHGRTAQVASARRKVKAQRRQDPEAAPCESQAVPGTRKRQADRSEVLVLPDWESAFDSIEQQAHLLGLVVDPQRTWGELTEQIHQELARRGKAHQSAGSAN